MCLMMTQTCLFYWCIGCIGQIYRTAVQERWNRTVLYINATSVDLGPKCFQLLGMHALVSSYPYGKEKISALNTLLAQDFPDVLGEVDTTHTDLVEATKAFFCTLYSQLPGGQPASNSSPRRRRTPQSDGPTSNIRKPVAACSAGLSTNYVVESSSPSRPTQ